MLEINLQLGEGLTANYTANCGTVVSFGGYINSKSNFVFTSCYYVTKINNVDINVIKQLALTYIRENKGVYKYNEAIPSYGYSGFVSRVHKC